MYTNGLYFNSGELGYEKRIKMNAQIINHSIRLRNLIDTKREMIQKAIHFTPIDYVILNSPRYQEFFGILKKQSQSNEYFQKYLKIDLGEREFSEPNINFLLEEIVVAHLIREQLVDLPSI